MATLRMAAGSMLGAVTDTANAASSVVSAISGSAGILNDYVTRARQNQQEAAVVHGISYRQNLMEDASIEAVKREENIRNYIGNDEGKKSSFSNFFTKLEQAFEVHDNKKNNPE